MDVEVDVHEFPRLCQHLDHGPDWRENLSNDGEQTQDDHEDREDTMPELEEAEENRVDTDDGDVRKFPKSPSMRSRYTRRGTCGWEAIDILSVTQCAKMPRGKHTAELIPNTLQEEWTNARNVIHELRRAAIAEEEKERALKWMLWMPQGLLHAPTRGGKNRTRQFKELARRLVLWR
jgi:hypothetical protein